MGSLRTDLSGVSELRRGGTTSPKDILLLNPRSGFLLDERVFLPLGIANIAAVAREQGHSIKLLDLAGASDYVERVVQEVEQGSYDVVGITATSPQFYYAARILEGIRRTSKRPKVIIGGPHASMFSAFRRNLIARFSTQGLRGAALEERLHQEDPNFASLEAFDVIAEGEENALAASLEADQKWVNGGITVNLDTLPLPARDLFDVKSYLVDPQGTPKFKIDGKASGSLIAQRGCPYQCEFCCGRDTPQLSRVRVDGAWRGHSPGRVLAELDAMHRDFGITSSMFYDDELNLDPNHVLKLCAALQEREYRYRGFVKSDLFVKYPQVASAMKEAGFAEVLTGVESGSPRILGRHLHKRTTPELNYQAAMLCLERKLGFKALTMLGHVSETEQDIMHTREWLLRVGTAFRDRLGPGYFTFDVTVFQPYPGSPIWDRAVRNTGEFSDQYAWKFETVHKGALLDPDQGGLYFNKVNFKTEHGFYKGVPGEYRAFIRTRGVSAERFVELRDEVEYEVRENLGMSQLRKVTSESQLTHAMGQGATQAS